MGKEQIQILRTLSLSIFFLLATLLPAHQATAGDTGKEASSIQLIAEMSDDEVRKLLLTTLQQQAETNAAAEAPGPDFSLGTLLHLVGEQSDATLRKTKELAGHIPEMVPDLYRVFILLCPYDTHQGAIKNFLWVVFFICLGLIAEKVVCHFLKRHYSIFFTANSVERASETMPFSERLLSVLITVLPSFLGVCVFFITAYSSYFVFIWTDLAYLKLLFFAVLLTITIIRIVAILAEILLSPKVPEFRLFPFSNTVAMNGRRLIVWNCGYIVAALMFTIFMERLGARPETVTLMKLLVVTVLLAGTAGIALFYKQQITTYILTPAGSEETTHLSWGKQHFASIWHILALLYLALLWCLTIFSVTDPGSSKKGAFVLSFFVLPIWMVADYVLQWIVRYVMINLRLYEEPSISQKPNSTEGTSESAGNAELFSKVKHYARLTLVAAVILWVASLWGYTIPFVSELSEVLFDALIIMTLALLFWQFITSWIERKIKESLPEESEEDDDDTDKEWGGTKAQGRAYTLLPIIRSFVASVLVIMVTLTLLSSMGIEIGPLLAGAGVIGLAVGFGAQKLVSDVLSGIFYLLDDAFRVGEYLSAGGIVGTVEKISLRNVMLRHHRGMLQIVPYSKLGTITNYMRGGITEKFSLDFAYDADIDNIRKVIKKVGIAMLEDPELGENFIRPIKSQGVREITNSVMTIRVKFTAKPGSQFVIRREAFKRITAALQAKGIHYAHKKVIVDLPSLPGNYQDPAREEKILHAAGAAAREIMDSEEALKALKAKEDSKK